MNGSDIRDVDQPIMDGDEMEGEYLTFWTDEQLFALPIAEVVQIIGMQHITEVPEWPAYIKGIILLRGSMIPLIDVRLRLAKAEKAYNERTCIIICSMMDRQLGLIVDEVDEVTEIPDERISPLPEVTSDPVNQYLSGIARLDKEGDSDAEKLILCMDVSKVAGAEDIKTPTSAAK